MLTLFSIGPYINSIFATITSLKLNIIMQIIKIKYVIPNVQVFPALVKDERCLDVIEAMQVFVIVLICLTCN